MRHIASSGLWVILAAKARYAAGEAWPRVPDVFHDERLAERYRAMWAYLATALAGEEGLAGYDVMSEPSNKHVAQSEVVRRCEGTRAAWLGLGPGPGPGPGSAKPSPKPGQVRFYEGVCAAVHAADASVPCVVGPAPFYKVSPTLTLNLTLTLSPSTKRP